MSDDYNPLPFDDEELRTTPVDFSKAVPASAEQSDSDVEVASEELTSGSSRVIRVRSGNATAPPKRQPRPVVERAPRQPLTLRSRRGVALVALGSLVVLAGVGTLANRGSSQSPAVPTVEPVASSELVCPITTATNDLTSAITAAVAPLSTVSTGAGRLTNLVKAGKDSDPLVIKTPGSLVARINRGKSGPAQMAAAIGSFATGFGADQSIRSGAGSSRGLSIAPCSRSVTDAWLVGGESTVGHITTVMLVNNDDRPAQVDLEIYGTDGQIDSPGAAGIAVAAASTARLQLAELAPSQTVTAVHVIATTGRVGATALEFDSRGLVPQGVSIMSATTAGRSLVIPMIPSSVDSARLVLLAPTSDATAHVTLMTTQGSIIPVGLDSVDLTAGHVASLDLMPVLDGGAGGLVIKADRDVVAGVIVTTGKKAKFREVDRTAATPALMSPGLIVGLAGPKLTHEMGIAAPLNQATVKVELFVSGNTTATWTRTVKVGKGSIVDLKIPVSAPKSTSIVVVTPVSGGPVYVTRVETERGPNGPMIGLAPVLSTRATTLVPPVEVAPGSAVLAKD